MCHWVNANILRLAVEHRTSILISISIPISIPITIRIHGLSSVHRLTVAWSDGCLAVCLDSLKDLHWRCECA